MAKKPPKDIGQLEPSNTVAKRQLRGYAVDKWKILDEKMIQKIDWRRAKIFFVVKKSCGNHQKENWIFCAANHPRRNDYRFLGCGRNVFRTD